MVKELCKWEPIPHRIIRVRQNVEQVQSSF